jgi:hypothetical protein
LRTVILIFFLLISGQSYAQQTDRAFKKMLYKNKQLKPILKQAQNYRIQIIFTPIINDKKTKTQYFNYSSDNYFYPASTIKLPAILLALEKVNELKLDRDLPYSSVSTLQNYSSVYFDTSTSIGNYVKKILLVSNNDSFNRLYDFIGKDSFNDAMTRKGFLNTALHHRLSIALSPEENNYTPKVILGDHYTQEAKFAVASSIEPKFIPLGKAHFKGDSLINEPMNFGKKNRFDLLDQHQMLMDIFQLNHGSKFNLRPEDLAFIKEYMSKMPRDADYIEDDYPDNYCKFFILGDSKSRIPEYLKIFNKIGAAYGFLIDNALIEDRKNDIKFLLSAVIYTNKNETLNDDTYEYEKVGFPFLAELGRHIQQDMLKHKLKN